MTNLETLQRHCTNDRNRKTDNSVWPLRGADGLTWAERKAKEAEQ